MVVMLVSPLVHRPQEPLSGRRRARYLRGASHVGTLADAGMGTGQPGLARGTGHSATIFPSPFRLRVYENLSRRPAGASCTLPLTPAPRAPAPPSTAQHLAAGALLGAPCTTSLGRALRQPYIPVTTPCCTGAS